MIVIQMSQKKHRLSREERVERAKRELMKVVGRRVSGGVAALVTLRYMISDAFQDPEGHLGGPFQSPIFAYPGGPILGVLDPIYASRGIRKAIVHVPNETIGGYAAVGFAKSTGKTGFGIGTSAPGEQSFVNPSGDAWADSTPVVFLFGNVAQSKAGSRAFQEDNVRKRYDGISKTVFYVTNATDIPSILLEAGKLANRGRPGPVIVDFPEDVLHQEVTFGIEGDLESRLSAMPPADEESLAEFCRLLSAAKRPMLCIGGGARSPEAQDMVRQFADKTGIPVAYTLMGKGVINDKNPQCFGMAGMFGSVAANAFELADLKIGVGMRFSDRTVLNPEHFASQGQIVQIDIDPQGIGPQKRKPYLTIQGDIGQVVGRLNSMVSDLPNIGDWLAQLLSLKALFPFQHEQTTGLTKPWYAIDCLDDKLAAIPNKVVATGVGNHQMWAAQHLTNIKDSREWITSGGHGAMGTDLSYAIGAALGNPDKTVVVVVGEASYEQFPQAVKLYTERGLNVKVMCIDNFDPELGIPGAMIGARLTTSKVTWPKGVSRGVPVVKLAAAYDVPGFVVKNPDEVPNAIDYAFSQKGPVVLDIKVDPKEKQVYPVMKPGTTVWDTILSKGHVLGKDYSRHDILFPSFQNL